MKILFLVSFSLLLGFVGPDVFAETEMTGWLRIDDTYSFDPAQHSYLYFFQSTDQKTLYRLNPQILPSNIIDWAGERVRVTIGDEGNAPLVMSLHPNEQFLDILSIELVDQPIDLSTHITGHTNSLTLLSKFKDVPTTPSEDPGTSPGQFKFPRDVAVDSSGNIYVIEAGENTGNGHRVQKFDSDGNFLFKFGQDGSGPGDFLFPSGIAVDSSGNIYVADKSNHRIQKFDSNGVFLFKVGANGGDGTIGTGEGEFENPWRIAVDSANIYVADNSNNRIQIFDSSGNFIKMFGWGVDTGTNTFEICTVNCQAGIGLAFGNGQFSSPRGIAVDGSGNIFVTEISTSRVQKFDSNAAFLMKFGSSGSAELQFNSPRGIAVDGSGNIYVADGNNHRIQKFDSNGGFLSMWGWGVDTGASAFETCISGCEGGISGSGVGQLNSPEGIASGSIYVADGNSDGVKKFDVDGVFLSELGAVPDLVHDSEYYDDIFYTNPGSLTNYYITSSYGKFTWDGSVNDWKILPDNQNLYITNFLKLTEDAIALHDDTVDFCPTDPVTNLQLIFNGQVGDVLNLALGSLGTSGTFATDDGCSITVSRSIYPDNGGFFCCGQTLDRGIGVAAHELGHNLTFEHTPPPPGAWEINNSPYHDPNSVMSTNVDHEAPSALIMPQRDLAGWVASPSKVIVADGMSATIILDFSNEPEGGVNPQMITVPLPDGTSYIIEGHQDGLFNDTPQDRKGAIIYKHFPPPGNQYPYLSNLGDKSAEYSLVATAGTDDVSDFDQAILEVGEKFEDFANSVTVETQSIGNSVTVFVSNNGPLCSPQAGQNWIISQTCTLTGDVTADMNITVQDSSVLTIPDGFTVFFDPATFSITIISGSGILVQQGGSIQTTP